MIDISRPSGHVMQTYMYMQHEITDRIGMYIYT